MVAATHKHHQRQSELIAAHLDWQTVFGARHFRCPNPAHRDSNPSAFVYPDGIYCFGCGWGTGDIGEACETFLGWDRSKTRRLMYNYLANCPPRRGKIQQTKPISLKVVKELVRNRTPQDTQFLIQKYAVSAEILDLAFIGYTGNAFSIPHIGLDGRVWAMKFRRDDRKGTEAARYWSYEGRRQHYLFPAFALWGYLHQNLPKRLLLCEGEFDALSALSHSHAAVSVPSGSATNLNKWNGIWGKLAGTTIYLAFDMDKAGHLAADNAVTYFADTFPDLSVVRMRWEGGKDLAELFVKGGRPSYDYVE